MKYQNNYLKYMYHFFSQNCQFDYKEKTNDTAGLFKWLILYLYL